MNYPLEEDKILPNKSKDGQIWISRDKYKFYPLHIPNVQCHVPGIYSSGECGLGCPKSRALPIKGVTTKNKALKCG